MGLPLGYFLTWTCYGQRLHGDARGSVDQWHNGRGAPVLAPDPGREAFERSRLKGPVVTLTPRMRDATKRAITELSAERRWLLLAHNAQSTHVHVVVNCRGSHSPERTMAGFKAKATCRLREEGLAAPDARLWTVHGSTPWLNTESQLVGAIEYVRDWQDGPNKELKEARKREIQEMMRRIREYMDETRRDEPRTE